MSHIIIISYGSQFTNLIARRIREMSLKCEIFDPVITASQVSYINPTGIILSGGPSSVNEEEPLRLDADILDLGIPILGICYGMQLLAKMLGGKVESRPNMEYGKTINKISNPSLLFDGFGVSHQIWNSHGDSVTELPPGFETTSFTNNCQISSFANTKKNIYGVQFHPEVSHTLGGSEILSNFINKICKGSANINTSDFISKKIESIKQTVGNYKVVMGVSGGIDSSVAAVLIHKAIGDNLICIFVDHGLIRTNDVREALDLYSALKINIKVVNAADIFIKQLSGITDPEAKRKLIGKLFVETFQEEVRNLTEVKFLAQGTIYPDIIESASEDNNSVLIKSHHNVGGLPDSLHLELLEPLKELFKDEVKQLIHPLKIPEEIKTKHPFPGPGLAIRIIGEIKQEYIEILKKADDIFINALKTHISPDKLNTWYEIIDQAFAVFLPIKSVSIVGDHRSYGHIIVLRAINTLDFMTADWTKLPYDLIESISNEITNSIPQISRVVYDVSSKPPSTIEWE